MRIWIVLLLVMFGTGCLVVPSKTTTARKLGTEKSEVRKGLSRGLELSTAADHGAVVVQAARKRDCKREVFEVTEVTEKRGLRMGGTDDPRAAIFAVVFAPVTLPVSLLVSSASLAGNRTHVHQIKKPVAVETWNCKEPAQGLPVEIELASGERTTVMTDRNGTVTFRIPPGEPYRGVIRARAEAEVTELKYRRKAPAVTAVRDAVTSCAGEHSFTGSLEVRVMVNPSGMPTKVELDHGDAALTTCITTQIADARFPAQQRDTTLVMPFSLGQ
jgi:hypothetical protein